MGTWGDGWVRKKGGRDARNPCSCHCHCCGGGSRLGGVGGEESGFVLAPLWLRQEKEFVGLFLFSRLKPREASVPSHGPRAAVGRVTKGLEMSWFTSWATPPGGRDLPALC